MEVFVEIDGLERFQTHELIVSFILGEGLVSLKFFIPLRLILRVMDIEGLPSGHREARFGQPGVASQAHHEKDAPAGEEQPGTYQFLFSRSDVGLLEVEVGILFEGFGSEEVRVKGRESSQQPHILN